MGSQSRTRLSDVQQQSLKRTKTTQSSQLMQKIQLKNSILYNDKIFQPIRFRRNVPQHNKGHPEKPSANIIPNGEKPKLFTVS